jgi:DNA-binding beta-propeller fold protein YncE
LPRKYFETRHSNIGTVERSIGRQPSGWLGITSMLLLAVCMVLSAVSQSVGGIASGQLREGTENHGTAPIVPGSSEDESRAPMRSTALSGDQGRLPFVSQDLVGHAASFSPGQVGWPEKTLDLLTGAISPGNVLPSDGLAPGTPVLDAASGQILIPEALTDDIATLDASTGQVVGSIPVLAPPLSVAFASTSDRLFVAEEPPTSDWETSGLLAGNGSIQVLNATTYEAIATVPVPGVPLAVAYDAASNSILVGNDFPYAAFLGGVYLSPETNLTVIDASTDAISRVDTLNGFLTGVITDPSTGRIFVSMLSIANYTGNISVFSASGQSLLATIYLNATPYGPTVDPADGDLDVPEQNNYGAALSIINLTTYAPVAELNLSSYFETIDGQSLDMATGDLFIDGAAPLLPPFIGVPLTGVLLKVSMSNDSVVGREIVGADPTDLCDTTDQMVYVANGGSDNLSLVSAASMEIESQVRLGIEPGGTPGTMAAVGSSEIYVLNADADNITVLNSSTDQPFASIALNFTPAALTFDPTDDQVFVSGGLTGGGGPGILVVIQSSTRSILHAMTFQSPAGEMVLDPATGILYVPVADNYSALNGSGGHGYIEMLNTTSDRLIGSIPVGPFPALLALDPETNDLYVASPTRSGLSIYPSDQTNVSVIHLSNDSIGGNVSMPGVPTSLIFDPASQALYATVLGSRNISVVNASDLDLSIPIPTRSFPRDVELGARPGEIYVTESASAFAQESATSPPASGELEALNISTGDLQGEVSVGLYPTSVLQSGANGSILVANSYSSSLSILSANFQAPPDFTIEFSETGLVVGTSWSVSLNGTSRSSSSSEIQFSEPNGTYSYLVTSPPGFAVTPRGGTLSVNGTIVVLPISYSLVALRHYVVAFAEALLPSGMSWSVTLNGTTLTSTSPTIDFIEPNATYAFTVGAVGSYTPDPGSGSVTVNGSSVSRSISFTHPSPPASNRTGPATFLGLPAIDGYIVLVGILVGAIVLGVVSGLVLRRKRVPSAEAESLRKQLEDGPPPPAP